MLDQRRNRSCDNRHEATAGVINPGSAAWPRRGVTYYNAENGFCVLRAKAPGHRDVVTVVGHAQLLQPVNGSRPRANGSTTEPWPAVQGTVCFLIVLMTVIASAANSFGQAGPQRGRAEGGEIDKLRSRSLIYIFQGVPRAAASPAAVALPLRIHSNPTAIMAPMIGPAI